jgi:RNA polymerase sigma factor (sigma-70 family)
MNDPYNKLVLQAKQGDKYALEELVKRIQDRIYGLSLRMLFHPQDAEDEAQEIIIKIITHLGTFRGDAPFQAWALKVAANHLLSARRKRGRASVTFGELASRIVRDWQQPWKELESEPMQRLIVEEFRIACLQIVLLGLDRPHRLAYILGEIFEVSGKEGGEILEIRPAAFRKRLQRARWRIRDFMLNNCALIRPGNPCLCERQADYGLTAGKIDTGNFVFANHPCRVRHNPSTLALLGEMDELSRISTLFKTQPDLRSPDTFVAHFRQLVDSKRFELLGEGRRSA